MSSGDYSESDLDAGEGYGDELDDGSQIPTHWDLDAGHDADESQIPTLQVLTAGSLGGNGDPSHHDGGQVSQLLTPRALEAGSSGCDSNDPACHHGGNRIQILTPQALNARSLGIVTVDRPCRIGISPLTSPPSTLGFSPADCRGHSDVSSSRKRGREPEQNSTPVDFFSAHVLPHCNALLARLDEYDERQRIESERQRIESERQRMEHQMNRKDLCDLVNYFIDFKRQMEEVKEEAALQQANQRILLQARHMSFQEQRIQQLNAEIKRVSGERSSGE